MGIRINKKLGWALTDLEYDGTRLTDGRVNQSEMFLSPPDEFVPQYLDHLKRLLASEGEGGDPDFDIQGEIFSIEIALEQKKPVYWPVTHDSEYGSADILLVRPVHETGWSRYDDPLDYADETTAHPECGPRVVPLDGIYPYTGIYIDSRDGRILDRTARRLIQRMAQKWDEEGGAKYRDAADHLSRSLGFDDAGQALALMAPMIPGDVRRFAGWAGLFTGPDVWLQLRPVLYVYWS